MTKFGKLVAVACASLIMSTSFASAVADDDGGPIIKNGIFFDGNERRLELKGFIEDRIDDLREERARLADLLINDDVDPDDRADLWEIYASFRPRLEKLYRDRALVRRVNFADFEDIEEFYLNPVSVS